jgi:hypothetical protein
MQKFGIGNTLSRTFTLVGRGFGSAGLFLLVAQAISIAFNFVVQPLLMGEMTVAAEPANPAAALGVFTSVWYWATFLFGVAMNALMYGGSIHGYLRAARGVEASLPECLEKSVTVLLPLIGFTLLWWIGISLGMLLLIVPGLILLAMWAAGMPAMVAEGTGVIESFGRSRALTRGYRLKIFFFLLLFMIVFYLVFAVLVGGLIGGASLSGLIGAVQTEATTSPIFLVATGLLGWLSTMLISAGLTAIYLELLELKEGGQAGPLADVFE